MNRSLQATLIVCLLLTVSTWAQDLKFKFTEDVISINNQKSVQLNMENGKAPYTIKMYDKSDYYEDAILLSTIDNVNTEEYTLKNISRESIFVIIKDAKGRIYGKTIIIN